MNLILFDDDELRPGKSASGELVSGEPPPGETSPGGGLFYGRLPRRDQRAAHILKVLRKKPGDTFDAGVLGGALGTAVIMEVNDEALGFTLRLDTEPPPRTPLRLAVGFPRPIQLRRLLRDCASLGLLAVDLFGTDLGEKSYRDTKLLREGGARAALREGAVQGRDTRLPELAVYPRLDSWLAARPWDAARPGSDPARTAGNPGPLLAAADNVDPRGSFSAVPAAPHGPEAAVLAVGPERGWSGRERELLDAAGFLRLSLGPRALRTETACAAASALLMDRMGLLDQPRNNQQPSP
ncbi:MAG: 16S rRNA (uracil(1498)-N(3))-methyltransferase [Treponema sp.]|nr:16S rRNA (uracil(1498)-N(3))-methyltransferase [Treponema sp.]